MLCNISPIHFVERTDCTHFSYTYRMPYNIKRVRATLLKKKSYLRFLYQNGQWGKNIRFSSFIWIFSVVLHNVTIVQKQA